MGAHLSLFRLSIVAVLTVVLGFLVFVAGQDAAHASGGVDIFVPLRWCGIGVDSNNDNIADPGTGAPSMEDPSLVGEDRIRAVLWRRHERVSEFITIPQVRISFRSAATAAIPDFPLIPDPEVPFGETPGQVSSYDEVDRIIRNCRAAWQGLAPNVTGITVVHIDQFVGALNGTGGLGGSFEDFCSRTDLQLKYGWAMVRDNFYDLPTDPNDSVLGHELGHALCLNHGDGVNADGDFKLDEDPGPGLVTPFGDEDADGCPGLCGVDDDIDGFTDEGVAADDDEDGLADEDGPEPLDPACATNLMCYGPVPTNITLTTADAPCPASFPNVPISQRHVLYCQALLHVIDREVDPVPPPVGSIRVDALDDVPAADAFVDMNTLVVAEDKPTVTTTFAIGTFGLLPANVSNLRYLFLADLDDNNGTGGSAAQASAATGIPTTFAGVELIGEVEVDVVGGIPQTTATVQKFQGGVFVPVVDPSIKGTVLTDAVHADPVPGGPIPATPVGAVGQTITLTLSNAVRGAASPPFPVEYLSNNPGTGSTDGFQGEMLQPPQDYPDCTSYPGQAPRKSIVSVYATDLLPNHPAHLLVGPDEVATGTTNGAGAITLQFTVPASASLGPHLLTLGTLALTADCGVTVLANSVGGVAVDLDEDSPGVALETRDSSGSNAAVVAGVIGAVAASTVALSGGAWYARRRWWKVR